MQPKSRRDEIVEVFFTGKNFNDAIGKLEPGHLRDDLKMEVALIICEWTDEKITSLYDEGRLDFYVVRVMINMITNKYHPFYKKFRSVNIEYKDVLSDSFHHAIEYDDDFCEPQRGNRQVGEDPNYTDGNERELREQLEDYTMEQIDSLYWYNRDLIKSYLRLGTYRAIQRETGIHHTSCFKTIKQSIAILRNKALAPRPVFTKEELSFIQNKK